MAVLQNIISIFQTYGVFELLIPFLLVFTVTFAILQKSKILGDKGNIHFIIALALGLIFVAPHITGRYPLGYDPVDILYSAFPSISLIGLAAIAVLVLLGIFGRKFAKGAAPFIAVASIIAVVYIFGASLGWWTDPTYIFYWWTADDFNTLMIILVFALVLFFVTRTKSESKGKGALKGVADWFEGLTEDA